MHNFCAIHCNGTLSHYPITPPRLVHCPYKVICFIPPGCTGLLQPVDVGYNKAFKAKIWKNYNKWLMHQDPDQPIHATSHANISVWIIATEENITKETITNTCRKTGYLYFGILNNDGVVTGDNAIIEDDPNNVDDVEDGEEGDV